MSLKTETVETYNKSAEAFAKKFDSSGARVDDITYVFSMCEKKQPSVLEIGCGNGRDSEVISKYTSNYTGIDISKELLAIAKVRLPQVNFQLADIESFEFPKNIDIVFAFASLIHVERKSFSNIMKALYEKMNTNGLVFVSLKYADVYTEITKQDEFGVRTYWHYSQSDLPKIASGFSIAHTSIQEVHNQIWMDILFQKK